jgi:hypothetical protein
MLLHPSLTVMQKSVSPPTEPARDTLEVDALSRSRATSEMCVWGGAVGGTGATQRRIRPGPSRSSRAGVASQSGSCRSPAGPPLLDQVPVPAQPGPGRERGGVFQDARRRAGAASAPRSLPPSRHL